MSDRVCDAEECTFAQTGVCMQSYADPKDCPSHIAALVRMKVEDANLDDSEIQRFGAPADGDQLADLAGKAVLTAPEYEPTFSRSGTLGLRETDALMTSRYVNLIGILGLPNAGKTACIASLYLLLAHGNLVGFSYASSMTLMALDEIARGARRWNQGNPPDQMTVHTELAHDRRAGFLHLRLRRDSDGRRFDLLMPDLPGEWSQNLMTSGDADRFRFLKAAEVVWLMADGREFVDEKTRQLATYHVSNLIERLAAVLPTPRPRIILVASWRDRDEFPIAALNRVRDYGAALGLTIDFASIASFSENDNVKPGIGLAELITKTLSAPDAQPEPWPMANTSCSSRAFLNFGKHP